MAENEKMPGNEAMESVGEVPVIPTALDPKDPAAMAAMDRVMKARNISGGDVARSGLMGAAMGAQAAAGSINPLSAFVQGMAAGLKAPAEVYAQKQAQVKSVIDATPFGVLYPEVVKQPGYEALAGLPSSIALETIKQITTDAAKVAREGEQARKTQKEKYEFEAKMKEAEAAMAGKDPAKLKDLFDISNKFSTVAEVVDFNNARPAYESLAAAPGNAAGDKTLLINFARLLSPTFRGNEGTMAAVDVSGILDKATIGLWNKAVKGEELQASERTMIKKEATRLFNSKERAYEERRAFWREKAADMGFDPSVIGRKYGQAKPMKTKMEEIVYVVDNGDGRFIEVGGE